MRIDNTALYRDVVQSSCEESSPLSQTPGLLLAGESWADDLMSPCLSSLIYKMGMRIPTASDGLVRAK